MRNERRLYQRQCGLCKKGMVSLYSPDKEQNVYCYDCYYGDGWDGLSYGRDFDFRRPFFEQWLELWRDVPKNSLILLGDNVNSDYTNDNLRLKNCYLVFDGEQAEDCSYGETFVYIKNSLDFYVLQSSELCYECVNCTNCYGLKYSRFCQSCSDSYFLLDCVGCKNCIGCVNLHQKQYHIFNQPYSKEEYARQLASFNLSGYAAIQQLRQKCEELFARHPKRYMRGVLNEGVTGDNLNSCKDTLDSFDCTGLRDCRYCTGILMGSNDCWDINAWGDGVQLAYNSAMVGNKGERLLGCYYVSQTVSEVYYSAFCSRNAHKLFGCAALRQKSHCILNKQYSPEQYEQLALKIARHMLETGEWGEFFPARISAFGYNETVAQEFFPLTKAQALNAGFNWSDYLPPAPQVKRSIAAQDLPDSIQQVDDEILDNAVICETTKRPFRITKPELQFYRQQNIPLPRRHPDQRHFDRLYLKNPRRLWQRHCVECAVELQSSYASARPERVLCEQCYQRAVFG